MTKNKGHIDWYVLIITVGLMLFSIAFVYSASFFVAEARFGGSEKLLWAHSIRVLFGFIILFAFAKIDYHIWLKASKYIIFFSILPLILVFIISEPRNGAYRWISLGFVTFQPSELAKFALVIHLSAILTLRQRFIKDFKLGLLPMLSWTILVCLLIAIQPNLSTALVIFIISITLMFIGNSNLLHLSGIGVVILSIASVYALSAEYRIQRLMSYIGMSDNVSVNSDAVFQMKQAILAFGNGGLFGLGAGQSRQSQLFLPESYGDFIYSIIGEEYGFFGAILLLSSFIIIFIRSIKIIRNAPDNFGYYLSFGITFTFAIYVFTSAGVNCGLLPTTGLPMPFISYGGSAILIYCAAMGILLNISSQANVYPKNNNSKSEN